MGPVTLDGLAGIFNLFWRRKQGSLLLLEGETTQELTQATARGRAWGAHTPRACGHAVPTAAAATLGMPRAFPLAQAPGGCQGCGCWGKRHGQLLGSEEGLAARGECEGCAWKGLPGLGCSTSTRGSCCPTGPWCFPRQLRLRGAQPLCRLCAAASLSAHSPKTYTGSWRQC